MKRLVIALALMLVAAIAPPVLAHGGTTTEEKTQGDYKVTHYTYLSVEQEEFVRPAWEVVDQTDGSNVDLSGESVTFEFYVDGSVERTEDFTLQQCPQDCRSDVDDPEGVYFADIDTGQDTTRIDNTLPLPDGGSVTFSLTEVTQTGGDGGNGDGGDGNLPLPAWLAAVALVGAAVALAHRRR